MADPIEDYGIVLDEAEPPAGDDFGIVLDEAAADVNGVENPAPAISTPSGLTNEELALRTQGPTVPLANGQSMLRSSITTEVAQGPVQFTSQGQPVLASSLDAPAVAKSREQEALEAKVRVAMEMGRKSNGTDLAQAAEIARQFNVPTSQVLPHLAQWKFAAESSTDDPADFIAKNRELVNQLADTPDVMAAVVLDPNVPSVIRALRVAKDMGVLQAMKNTGLLGEPPPLLTAAAKKIWDMANGVSSEQRAAADAQAAADEAAATERERNAKVTKFDNQEARVIRAAGGMVGTALTIAQRTKEAWYQQEMASGGLDLLIAEAREELGVGDEVATGEALARVQNARAAARPLLLGDEGTMLGVAGDNMQAIVSTSNVLLGKAKAAGVLGAVLGVAGGVVGGIVGKGPGAREGAMLGAETGAKLGSKVGGFTAAFAPETGGAYLENRDAVTDEGRRFTKLEAAGGALVYGAVASWLENLGADEVMAPAAGALKARVQKLLLNDPMFRSRAADLAKAWAKGMLSEGGTEGLQSISEQLVSYAAKSLKDEKLQRGPAWSDEQAATEAFAGMWGGGVTTAASTGVAVTWEMVEAEERARTSPQQVALIATLAEQAPVQAAPGEFAKVVTEASGVTEFWVDVTGTRKYQEDSKLDDDQLELQIQEAGGQEALDSYKESLATGGKFQVPLTTALKTWLKSPLGQALLEHTSTSDSAPTPRQVAEGEAMAAIEAHAKELTEKAIAEMQDEQDFEDVLSKMEQDIADSSRGLAGISNPREYARDAVKAVRAQYSVVKSDNPTWSWEQVVEYMGLLKYAKGDEAPVGQEGKKLVKAMDAYTDLRTVLDFGGKDGGPLSQEQAAELIFVDEVSNLRDPEAFDLEGVPEGMQVAMVTTPDAKAINDEPTGSHDATNALLRRMAGEVAKMDPRAARIGTNFAVRVRDQEQLDSLLDQLRGVLPAGVVAVGAVAQDREAAQKAMDALVDKGRADGVIPPRGGTAFDLATLPTVKFDAGVVLPAPAPVTDALLNAVGPDGQYEGREKLGTRAFLDRDVPGLLSGLGFRKAKKGKFTVALDLRGLRDVNIALGKAGGNAMLRAFGEALVRLGGEAFAAAHLSGDEYAMTHDSQEALEEFIADLEADLQESGGTTYTTPGGQTLKLPVRFRWGIAEGTYGRADQDLNTRKRAEQAGTASVGGAEPGGREGLGGARGDAREAPGAQGRAGVDLGARAGSVEQRNARALRRRGGERSRPFRDVAAELAAEQGEAGLGFGEDELAPRLTSFASPEVVAEARRWVGRMRSPARKARFSAWLDYAAGLKERPTPELFLERDEGVQLVDLFGPELDNPDGSFFDTPLLQGVEATKKTSRAEREQRRRARWNDAGMAENQASRMADANRARGKLDFDATGRRVLQEGADQGVAALPAGQPVPGRSDTSDFTALLSTAQREQGLRVEVQRMPGREESKPDKNGRVKFGRRFETLRASLLSKENPVVGEGEVIGSVAPGADGVMELNVSEAELDEKFQNQRLGVALYEALYRQALDLGAVRVVGGAHTPAASRVHQSLTRKHGLTGYEPKPAKGNDGKIQPYSYNLQPERLFQSAAHTLSDGRTVIIEKPGSGIAEDQSSTVWLINVDGFTQALDGVAARFEQAGKAVDDTSTQRSFDSWREQMRNAFDSSALYLRQGRVSQAVDAALNAVEFERRLTGDEWTDEKSRVWKAVDDFIDTPGLQASKVEVQTGKFERQASADAWGKLSEEDRQTVQVALDEYEAQTGRLYQSEQAFEPLKLSNGRQVVDLGSLGDRSWVAVSSIGGPKQGRNPGVLRRELGVAHQTLSLLLDDVKRTEQTIPTRGDDLLESGLRDLEAGRLRSAWVAIRNWVQSNQPEANEVELDRLFQRGQYAVGALAAAINEAQQLTGEMFQATDQFQLLTLDEARGQDVSAGGRATPAIPASDAEAVQVWADQYEAATGRMRQDDEKKASDARPPKGYFIPPTPGVGRVMRVFLNRRADRSTVFHESAHGFLEMQHNAANIPGVSQKTKDRWARIMKWLDVSKYEEIKTEHHERWAKAFELYTKEGRAPKAELTSTFARMKRWLTRIYGAATSIDGVELDPEVRAIFDSMLATEQEIARQAGKRGQSPWTTAEEAGMTEEQFAEYQDEERESLDFSTREAAARFTKASLRAAEADFAEMLDAQRAKAEAEYEALPGRKAQRYLEGQALDLLAADVQMAPTVLDRKAVENAVGVYAAKRFRTRAQGATMPDDVAPMVQFPTGKEMLQAIVALPVKEKWVEARAKVLAEQADPQGAADLQKLRDDVANGLQKYTEEKMARLWAEFGRRAEPGDDVSELGRQVALQALKKAGRMVAERTRVGRLNPRAVLAKERQAARVVREAVRKGNFDAARDWFRQQTLQAYAHGAVLDAIEERQRFESLVARLAKPASRARFGKADPRLRDALDYLLAQFGLAEDMGLTGEALKAGIESIAETAEEPGEWQEALQTPELLGSGDYLNLTVAQLRHLDAALRQLDATVRFRTEVMVGEKMADRAATTEALLEEGSTRLPDKAPPVTRSTESAWETLASKASAADGFLLNPADLLRDLAGDNVEGVWWKTIIEPMRRAKYREAELLKQLVEPVTKAMEALPVEVRKRSRERINGRKMFPGHIDALVPRERHELLMMALNVGNEGNLQRLTDGRKITVEQVAAALDTLTDAELAWVESVWDAASLLKDESFALEERLTGLRPRGVEPVPFRLPSGRVLKGGYFPAVYDSRASTIGQKQAESQLAALQDPRTTRASTPHSHVKARAEAVSDAAIKLDPEVIYRHLAQVAHDVAFREAIKSVGSILLPGRRVADDGSIVADNRVAELLAKKLGPEKAGTFMQWLKDVGGASGANVTPLDPYITGARGAFAHVLLGWKLSTAVGDFANLPAAVASTSLKAKHLLAAQRDCLRAPFESRAKALEASPWLRSMVDTTRQQFDRSMKQMLDKGLPAPLQWYKDNAFVLMETVSAMTATPVWMGAHRQAIAEGRSHEEAVRFADDILSQVFPSHSPVDIAGILRDRGVVGLSTVMYGYLSVAYRAQHRILGPLFTQEFRDRTMGGKAMTVANVTGRLVGFYIAFSVMGELLMGRGPEEGDEDKDDPENKLLRWRNWFMRKMLVAPASTLPFADLAKAIEAKMTGKKKSSARAAPLNTLFEMISDQASMALDGDQPALKRAGAGLTLMLEGLGLPVSPVAVQGKFLADVLMGDIEPEGPLDVASGLVYGDRGAKQPANIFKP